MRHLDTSIILALHAPRRRDKADSIEGPNAGYVCPPHLSHRNGLDLKRVSYTYKRFFAAACTGLAPTAGEMRGTLPISDKR